MPRRLLERCRKQAEPRSAGRGLRTAVIEWWPPRWPRASARALATARDPKAYIADEANAEVRICAGTRLPRLGPSRRDGRRSRRSSPSRGLADTRARGRDRLPRLLRAGAHRGALAQGDLLPSRAARATWPGSSRRASSATASTRSASTRTPSPGEPIALREGHPLLQRAAAPRAGAQRQDRPLLDRRLPGPAAATSALAKVLADDDPDGRRRGHRASPVCAAAAAPASRPA